MHGTLRHRHRAPSTLRRAGAITWIDQRRAIVARATDRGDIQMSEYVLPEDNAGRLRSMAAVARSLGRSNRIIVTGPEASRTTLEREFVSMFHAPERIEDVEPEGPLTRADLVALLRERQGA